MQAETSLEASALVGNIHSLQKVEFAPQPRPRWVLLIWPSLTSPGPHNNALISPETYQVECSAFTPSCHTHSKELGLLTFRLPFRCVPPVAALASGPDFCAASFVPAPPALGISGVYQLIIHHESVYLPASRPVSSFSFVPHCSSSSPLPTHDRNHK